MNNRAYSLIEIKAFDEEKRIIGGRATSPKTDRMEDIVESAGAEFKLPIPFLWQHDRTSPIGHVTRAKVGDDGIDVEVQLARTDEPGELKNLLDKAWQQIKLGLVRGLSIGFRPLEDPTPIKNTLGWHYKKWEWLELSAVTIPANVDASIAVIRSLDSAASGKVVRLTPPGASGQTQQKTRSHEGKMNVTEQIKGFEGQLAAKLEQRAGIQQKALDEGRTKDESEQEQFDTLSTEIEAIKKELADLRVMEKDITTATVATAKAVSMQPTGKTASLSRAGTDVRVVELEKRLEPGIEFARYARCLGAALGNVAQALSIAETLYPDNTRIHKVLRAVNSSGVPIELMLKADVSAGTTQHATYASPLVEFTQFAGDFVEFLRPRTIIGQFGQNNVPDFRRVPFNVNIKSQTSGGTAYWVGEAKPKPVTSSAYGSTQLTWAKIAAIAVETEELLRFSSPSSDRLIRDDLAGAVIEKMDGDFIDPTVAAVANVNPASITNGVAGIAASGTDADALRADILNLWEEAMDANLPLTDAVYITTPSIGMALGLLMNPLGQPEFPNINMRGGSLLGVPVITSNHVPGGLLILVFASEIWLADDGQVTVDASREASIQMLDNPTNASDTPTPTTLVSMWQTNSIALRAERFINWAKRRSQAVAYIHGAAYAGAQS